MRLPQRMAADAGGGDALPLLAYALQELYLAAGSTKVWDATITIEDLVAAARSRVSRQLTAEERRNLMLPSDQ